MSLPEKLGKYEIRRLLGKGAMGIVYEGYDPFIQRRVALKTIRKDLLDQEQAQEMLARFQREAQAGGRLSHPNIVAIHEYGEDGDTAFIAMEFVEGRELRQLFAENTRFGLPDTLRILSQLLSALGYSHNHGVVHRDIKPANIIVMPNGQVKIADFGIARLEQSNLTQTGSVLGTPYYMSPEQFMGQHVDGRSDLFSAGVILYQFLTGEKPFTGESSTTIMYQVLNATPAPPSALNVALPRALDEVLHRALAKRPEDRFQRADEFQEALLRAVTGDASSAADVTLVASRKASADPTPTPQKWLWFGVAAAIVAAVLLVFSFSGGKPTPAPVDAPPAPPATATPQPATPAPAAPATTAQKKQKPITAPPYAEKKPPPPGSGAAQNPASKPSEDDKAHPRKKGLFGEEVKPSQWRKEGELF